MVDLPCLTNLNVSGNKMESLNGFPDLPCLKVLTLDGNPIASAGELNKLSHLKNLVELSMNECPLSEEKGDDMRKEVLISLSDDLKHLKIINGEPFTEEELQEAKEERK